MREQRLLEPNRAIEHADCAIIKGNEFTLNTYRYANKPLYRVPQTTPVLVPPLKERDFEVCRRNFLWLSGGGMVHKGLDLALEAFSAMPDYHLYVCGAIHAEADFEKIYYKELYETPNIHAIGWVDVKQSEFTEIVSNCVGHIHLSCSECSSGSVILCMQAGLIPIASYESGVDVNDFGVILNDCSLNTIKETVKRISALPSEKLREMSRQASQQARTYHTRENFAKTYRNVIEQILFSENHPCQVSPARVME
jgi:glycosyltransferase involved in cell wall biosynthesis